MTAGIVRIGLLGAGRMAEAIARGLLAAGSPPESVAAYDPDERRRGLFEDELGVRVLENNGAVASFSDVLIVAVKPHIVQAALTEAGPRLRPGTPVISIAAGLSAAFLETLLPAGTPVVRAMPNTPCLVREGVTAICAGSHSGPEHLDAAEAVFSAVGRVVRVAEDQMDAVTGLSGSGPAYVYTFIEALADGGVRMGLPRPTALLLAAQTAAGAARLVLESGSHPAELRDGVTTPGGTTAAAMASLESNGFRFAVMDAVRAAAERSAELGGKKNGQGGSK